MIFGLTSLGEVHTAISLVAVGIVSLVRYREITPGNLTGQVYVLQASGVLLVALLIGAALLARRLHAGPSQ